MRIRERNPKTKTEAGGSTAKVPAQQSPRCASVEVTVKQRSHGATVLANRAGTRWLSPLCQTQNTKVPPCVKVNQNNGGLINYGIL